MDLELTLATENGEYQSQQRRNSRSDNLQATTEPANQLSNNHLMCSCESTVPHNNADDNDNNIDIYFG
ncbi:unnamed protein product [Rotaria sordida]|uniref:Uncharacterized protein n=1 Tax=Rotaria sordida TaxID=392033 RepID=A0A815LE11_9BILA|nr:unnamed protein product [Rotaria sordida]CAF1626272.1 unnamed protein product [Rotaria sordida]